MKKYRISEEKIFSRTPTPPTGPSLRNIPGENSNLWFKNNFSVGTWIIV